MGFAGVYSGSNLPDIWEVFNSTKGKKSMHIAGTYIHA
jgi:hypothetical protein